jgi:hypothetical protein
MSDNVGPLPMITLEPGMTLSLWPVDPTTGTPDASVEIYDINIYGVTPDPEDAAGTGLFVPPFLPYGTNT